MIGKYFPIVPRFPKLRSEFVAFFWVFAVSMLMSFVHKRQNERVCQKIDISIQNQLENYFVEETDVKKLVTLGMRENIENVSHRFISLKELENRVKTHGFIEKVVVSKDLMGGIEIQVWQYKPMARVTVSAGSDKYISTSGKILPLSDRYTARVMVIQGPFGQKLLEHDWDTDSLRSRYLELVAYIYHHDFYKNMVASIHIHSDSEITLLPQIGKQIIEFGPPENIENKFERLQAFYQKIVAVKGWNRYHRVCLKYKDQIVCE